MIYTPEMMRTLARQHDEDSDTRAALMQAADKITALTDALKYADRAARHGIAYDSEYVANTLKGE